jgi:hypothetical protein
MQSVAALQAAVSLRNSKKSTETTNMTHSVVTELCHLLQTVLDVLLLSDDPSTLRSVEHIHFRVYVVESVFEILV